MFGINVPRYALVNREVPNQELDYFVEEEDFVEVHGERFWKPFVEKPINGKATPIIHTRVGSILLSLFVCNDWIGSRDRWFEGNMDLKLCIHKFVLNEN